MKEKLIFDGKQTIVADHINAYLLDAPDIFVDRTPNPRCNVPPMGIGNKPIDGGYYLFKPDEYEEFIRREPRAKKYFRRWFGGDEFLYDKIRYCLWLGEATVEEIKSMPLVEERVDAVRRYRASSKSAPTRKIADKPTRFHVENMPTSNYIVIPEVSSERRKYIPIGFMTPDVLCSNLLKLIPNATLYHFGVLTSSVHMTWTKTVCGRLESRYRYSASVVYNNFPWLQATVSQRAEITRTAQNILDARKLYPAWTLAALYDPDKMPLELRAAHEANDAAVMSLYMFDDEMTELDIITTLLLLYQRLVDGPER